MPDKRIVARLLGIVNAYHAIRAPSLLITIFGDTVSQHGGTIWLGSLIRTCIPLGLSERAVRTSAYRLVQDGWLGMRKSGKRSFYSLSAFGASQFAKASRRIYAADRTAWNGRWTLVMLTGMPAGKRELLIKSLAWQGYGKLTRNLYAHPLPDHCSLDETLQEMGLKDRVVIWESANFQADCRRTLQRLVCSEWGIEALGEDYRNFLAVFGKALRSIKRKKIALAPISCFQLRTLLIHEYRRILLKDMDLPVELLPPDWPGSAAQGLVIELYRNLGPGALEYIREELESNGGKLSDPASSYFRRFGGLPRGDGKRWPA